MTGLLSLEYYLKHCWLRSGFTADDIQTLHRGTMQLFAGQSK